MLFADHTVVIRGGGDLATGVAHQLHHAGFPVIVLELDEPLAIRRTVALVAALFEGEVAVDGLVGREVGSPSEALSTAPTGVIPVLASRHLPDFDHPPSVLVDARMAKRNIDTTIGQARLVVGLGPGFTAGLDCHAVIETARGHRLGRVIWDGSATPDTGSPGEIAGETDKRVIRAETAGKVAWTVAIGDLVAAGQHVGRVGGDAVTAAVGGVVRGLLHEGTPARAGMKIADIDPRGDRSACFEISDKARLVGAGVLEAVLVSLNRG